MSNPKSSSATPTILRPNEIARHDRGGGAATTPLVSRRIGATGFINGITEFRPGAVIPFHSHNCEESVVLLEGEAVIDINGESVPLSQFDTTWIPPNVVHRFRNASEKSPMKILWIYASMDATRTLEETGETRPVASEHR
ncbi:cupin domain-containing protein [Paraburkholderia largidicola]|uniref:Cupin n=1 Tax=Paraburkholderia largidicola TaxID=3014751 RepID=A0A7I8C325_9BURK|nr:cupin domain-containing protein [Paraburkholderia sp. PGU16]BCF95045.1 cupin [Paraburkholderia sp. PGU16]